MGVYQGSSENGSFIDWATATDGSIISIDGNSKYDLQLATLGWQHAAQSSFGETTNIGFTVDGSGGENIDLWLIPTDKHALFYGNNLTATNIPIGESVRIIAMALNQDDEFVVFDLTTTITADMVIDIEFETTTEEALLTLIDTL